MLKKIKAFTLVEMLVVLFIISVLLLIFLPEVKNHYSKIEKTGDEAIISLVDSQREICYMSKNDHNTEDFANINKASDVTVEMLKSHGHIDEKQVSRYNDAIKRKK